MIDKLESRLAELKAENERIRQDAAQWGLTGEPLPYGSHRRAYEQCIRITGMVYDDPFYGLLMATMRAADTLNAIKLREAFPEVWLEMFDRHNAPAGLLPMERMSYPETSTPED